MQQSTVTQLNNRSLIEYPTHTKRWEARSVPEKQGKGRFAIGKISGDITFTHSQCFFYQPYQACINYDSETALLVFGIKGTTRFHVNDQQAHLVRPGDVWLFVVDNESLFRTTPAEQNTEMVVIKYAKHRLNDTLQESDLTTSLACGKACRLAHQAEQDFMLKSLLDNPLSSASERLIAESQVLQLLARWIAPNNAWRVNKQALPMADQVSLDKVVDALTTDLTHPPSLHALATLAGMSHAKLNRCFNKVYGTSVFDWLRQYKLQQGRYYLDQKHTSITSIAFQCGFSSASHFAHTFKQHFGYSPTEYRAQQCDHGFD